MDEVPKKKTVSVNFTRAVFSLFDFLTLVPKHRYTVSTVGFILSQKQGLCVVWFRAIWFGTSLALRT
jgi:hypothetical protein